jgi:peroxin-5
MSFLGAPECSTAGNPLGQFTKHVQEDNSLQRDRLVNRTPNGSLGGLRGGFRSIGHSAPQDEVRRVFCPCVLEDGKGLELTICALRIGREWIPVSAG